MSKSDIQPLAAAALPKRRGGRPVKASVRGATSTREVLLIEAERLINLRGVEQFKLTELADIVGIHNSSIFAHYPDGRAGLIAAIICRTTTKVGGLFPSVDGDPEALLSEGVTEMVLYFGDHPGQARLVLLDLEIPGGLPVVTQMVGEFGRSIEEGGFSAMGARLSAILRAGEEQGIFRKVNMTDAYHLMLGMALIKVVDPSFSRAQAARIVVEAVLRFVRREWPERA